MTTRKVTHKVIIIGSGPAGYTAAIYASRAMLNPIMITGPSNGGQLVTTTDVENFPGYPSGILGPELMNDLEEQAKRFGTKILCDYVKSINTETTPFEILCSDKTFYSNSVIIATGAEARWLGAKGEKILRSNGVSTCATCDGAFFKGEELLVIGGGDSAMEEAIFLTRYASKVTIVHRRDVFKASKIMLDRARNNPNIIWKTNVSVKEWITKDSVLTGALLDNDETINCGGAFIAIGHDPSTKFLKGVLELDDEGYIVHSKNTMSSVPGIFACGDVCVSSRRYKQAVTASGEGCKAAMDCEKWLEEKNL
uniref:FAD/NAD(P)-binding domain-containing protein n=1 Tax=viral metagenome TaxID=1070528 RepID=A0A6C0LW62_9ZZZZ